jgi:hypothetical protein
VKELIAAGACLLVLSFAGPAVAHHSAAGIDRTKTVTLVGTVKEFRWTNPHSWIQMDVPNAKGGVDTWTLEMTSPAFLVRAGWKSTTLKQGDKVTAVARPLRNGDPGGLFVSVTTPTGQVFGEQALPPAQTPAAQPPQP